ncbi:DNA-binding response regulator, OmpR family, contains REC and winged-helix (wHTH) domain [Pseudomonas sp. LAMO17WK12:I10]|uniref:response regulator transcription factor n=1 Tax=unclassified Pseudomonas TaxID=196821 RepID=UPI000BDDB065|nr:MULTISPECIES: response regulator transcription factor [unclassified Pseudomonas]PXX64379.1 DNA-binding response OmpR family regulator [Pseudomonas sp. LAMO17WK12:I9]SNY39529.1 DNA-binding response regulator, OmpR family, contains REC and winged-helix (wHTH) domain [Pseudomonas sp. LAMO17WK12:I10]
MRILIIEDNPDIVANLYEYFEPLGHELDKARTGHGGLARIAEQRFDVIVLDGRLPGLDGLEVCRRLREEIRCETPVLMLTARDTVHDKVDGLQAGADDYLVKPYSLIELEARLHALVRRAGASATGQILRFGELEFDTGTFEARRAGQRLELTPFGYKMLAALLRAAPRLVTREELEQELWKDDPPLSDALRSHIHALRQVIDKSFPLSPPMLLTVSGIGYRLVDHHVSQ